MSFIGIVFLIFAPSIHAQTCGGTIELTPNEPTASFQAPNYPNPQTFTETVCRWVFVAPNSESMTLDCPVISTRRRCRRNRIIYIQSRRRRKLCGELRDVERTTTADRFELWYSYTTHRSTATTGFTCTASASFTAPPPDPVTPPIDPVTPSTDPVTPVTDPVTPSTDPVTPVTDPVTPPTDPAPQCSCGGENLVSRIVGGQNAIKHQFPWMVRLIISNRFLCGASLISDEWILTAAHCVNGGTQASAITAHIGDHDKSTSTETDNTITVQGIDLVVHPDYNSATFDNDIALVKISPITITQEISPICLPFNRKEISGKEGRVAGWGTTSSGGSTPNILQWVQVNLLTAAECRAVSSYGSSQITDNMNCAEDSGKDSCQGDSGGPLFLKEDGYNFEVGVVSWGRGCALANYPGVYADVQVYTDWIEETTEEAFCKK